MKLKLADAANVVPFFRREPPRRGSELEFLPAALEIVETPASPAGRAIAATIIVFFAIAIAWAYFGHVDIIATATGQVVPTGRVKTIQPFEIGVVRAIDVRDGQQVKSGQVLIQLDPTIDTAERNRVAKELLGAELDVARLKAAVVASTGSDPNGAFKPPAEASPEQIALHRALLANAVADYQAKIGDIDRQIVEDTGNRDAVEQTVAKLEASLPIQRRVTAAYERLNAQGYAPTLQLLQSQQQLVENEHELDVQKARLVEADGKLGAVIEQGHETEAEFRRQNLNDLAQAETKAASLREELVKAAEHQTLQTLTAPVDGTVQQLSVHTVGGVVTPAQQLLVIVPADSQLEVNAQVKNKDIGFVRAGQTVAIKVDTFNFTKYGLLHGEVQSVSRDAITRDKRSDKSDSSKSSGAVDDSSEPSGQEFVYAARISLDSTQMQIGDRLVDLTPGMAVTAEIKTGRRRVIEYLLSPLLRYKQEALRER